MKLFEVLKRVFSAAIVMTASLAQFTSCDSREDWFAKEGEGFMFIIKTQKNFSGKDSEAAYDFRVDTLFSKNTRRIVYDLKVSEVGRTDGKNTNHPYIYYFHSEAIKIDVEGIGEKVTRNDYEEWSTSNSPSFGSVLVSPYDYATTARSDYFVFVSDPQALPRIQKDTVPGYLGHAELYIRVEDAFRNSVYCVVELRFWNNIPPIQVLEIKDVDGQPTEKILSLANSYDKDGSVMMYEYCIDGNVRDKDEPKYDCDINNGSGKGAYGGTYITASDLSEVKHAFQTEGEHTIYYRCMDNLGLWSAWKSELVTINK